MEELGFKLEKETDTKIIYKRIYTYTKKLLGIDKEMDVLIFNKLSKRVFMQRYFKQCGELKMNPFCMDLQLLNEINKILKNMWGVQYVKRYNLWGF